MQSYMRSLGYCSYELILNICMIDYKLLVHVPIQLISRKQFTNVCPKNKKFILVYNYGT